MGTFDDVFKQMERESRRARKGKKRNMLTSPLLFLVSVLITIPLFVIIYRFVPDVVIDLGQRFRLDHVLTFTIILLTVRLLVYLFRNIVLGAMIALLIVLGVNELRGGYGFSRIYVGYMDLIAHVQNTPVKLPFLHDAKMTVRNAAQIREAVDYQNPTVRTFAVKASQKHFNDPALYRKYGKVIRFFSIFKEINTNWTYVHDPRGENYYASASESVKLMAGDCDDHSTLMAAAIKAIGGEPRVVHTERHLYPEVKVCHEDDFDDIIYLIKRKLFYKEALGKNIYYHRDSDGYIWLNFDYTDRYPGAPFMEDSILGILHL